MTARPTRILQIAHNHPEFGPGGTEILALALHRRALDEGVDSWFLGAVEPFQRSANPGTHMIAVTGDQREAVLFAPVFDRFGLSQPDSWGILAALADYLRLLRPDVVHFHHVLNLGLEAIAVTRAVLPRARILLTLHDYYLVCANHGQLYRHDEERRCPGPAPTRCARCVGVDPVAIALRNGDVSHVLAMVDEVVSPSRFLADLVATAAHWGKRVRLVPNGHVGDAERAPPAPPRAPGDPAVFGFFGNLSRVKGVPELMEAARLLLARGVDGFRLHVHGAQLFPDDRVSDAIAAARQALGPRLVLAGGYDGREIPRLIAPVDVVVFPSVWVENAPLTLLEAMHHRRAVIAFPHGAAPEILAAHGPTRLAGRSDAAALADAMEAELREGRAAAPPPREPAPGDAMSAAYRRLYAGCPAEVPTSEGVTA